MSIEGESKVLIVGKKKKDELELDEPVEGRLKTRKTDQNKLGQKNIG